MTTKQRVKLAVKSTIETFGLVLMLVILWIAGRAFINSDDALVLGLSFVIPVCAFGSIKALYEWANEPD